ncbi:tumor necrosis factor-like [Sphaerodactylus townsendi]|uniref:tumor necrosis factor-like n=1 Tax=Sphaerodactylus townsendi TaxID=933632 RepID=UPI0020273F6A|nr:tumor necrosis factor-like [Sphaerodactylus townsendi]
MSSEQLVYDVEKGSKMVAAHPSRQDSHWKCLSICSFLLLVGAVTVFTLLQFGAFGSSADQNSKENGNPFPARLSEFQNCFEEQTLIRQQFLFAEGMPQTLRVRAAASGKPAIHAIASRSHLDNLIWITGLLPAMDRNMKLDKTENALVVPSTGLYFVYSQLLFHGENCREHSESPLLLTHTISSKSTTFGRTTVDLMKTVKSVCESENTSQGHNKLWFESIYQGGVFQLQEGDKLFSNTESTKYLDRDREGQLYFGAVALDLY